MWKLECSLMEVAFGLISIWGGGTVEIGRYCSFASGSSYLGANHPMDYAVQSAYFYNKQFGGLDVEDIQRQTLQIGHDVWVGHNTTIVTGCKKVGNGAVIAAGAVVTKDVPPYAVVAGVPAKIIRYRFDRETIDMLERSEWWKHTPEELMKYYALIREPMKWAQNIITDKESE